jgi:hypothetical protein
MTPNDSGAIRVILTATDAGGDRIDLVEYTNDGCGLLRNGVPIPGMKWVPCDMAACTAALSRVGGLGKTT